MKEIKQIVNESVWDYDQRFNMLKYSLPFQIPYEQHREWFIAGLLSHIHCPLMQQNIKTQSEALEISMKFEASIVGENNVGMAQV
jgi:hypothetical protein